VARSQYQINASLLSAADKFATLLLELKHETLEFIGAYKPVLNGSTKTTT
jgi:hypothetical protein